MIAVRLVIGEDGLIAKAQGASATQKEAEVKEEVRLALHSAYIAKRAEGKELGTYLQEKFVDTGKGTVEEIQGGYKLTYKGYEFEIGNDFKLVGDKAPTAETSTTLLELWESGKLKQGDYVDYNPEGATSYDPDQGTVGSLTGYNTAQNILQDDLDWRVLGKDGDKILLISASPTNEVLAFNGYIGYNNYEDVLEDTCNALYSNENYSATARNITMDDIDTYLGGSAIGNEENNGYEYGEVIENVTSKYNIVEGKLVPVEGTVTINILNTYVNKNFGENCQGTLLQPCQDTGSSHISAAGYYISNKHFGFDWNGENYFGFSIFEDWHIRGFMALYSEVVSDFTRECYFRPVVEVPGSTLSSLIPNIEDQPYEWTDSHWIFNV